MPTPTNHYKLGRRGGKKNKEGRVPYLKFSKVFEGYPFYSYHSSTFPVFPQERRAKPLLMVQASYLSFVIGETVLAPRSSYTWGRGGPATLYAQGRTQTSGLSPIKVRPARVIIASHKFITCIDILMAFAFLFTCPFPIVSCEVSQRGYR